MIRKRGETLVSPLLCARRAQRHLYPLRREVGMPSPRQATPPPLRDWQGSKLLPPLKRAGERHLVHEFQMPADRDAVRQAGNLDPERLQKP